MTASANPGSNEAALVPNVEGGAGVPSGAGGETSKKAELRKRAMDASRLNDVREGRQEDSTEIWGKYLEEGPL